MAITTRLALLRLAVLGLTVLGTAGCGLVRGEPEDDSAAATGAASAKASAAAPQPSPAAVASGSASGVAPGAGSAESGSVGINPTPTSLTSVRVRATAQAAVGRCPEGMALIQDRFCIDRWEAGLRTASGEAHSPYHSVGSARLTATTAPGVVPQAYISMNQAKAACQGAGKRLCSTAEWLDACAGSSKRPLRTYPYGNTEEANACNVDQVGHPTMILHQGRRKTDSYWMNDPRINQLGATVAPSGAFPLCTSPEGVQDMVGNLLEWTQSDRPLLMGGYYLDSHENGDGCRYVTMRHGADYHDFSTGFRCCASAKSEAEAAAQLARQAELAEPAVAAAAPDPAPSTAPSAEPARSPTETAAAPEASATPAPALASALPRPEPAPGSPRDPEGFRSFLKPGAPLPKLGPRADYASSDAACPSDMVLAEGERCTVPIQTCKYWVDDPGMPARSCGEFAPSVCKGAKLPMRYCIDRYEFTPPGYTYPIVNVSWGEAQNLCGKHGKRLCLEAEWEFACEGPEALPYPYGYKRDGAACNHDLPELFTDRGKLNDQRVPGDSLPRCKSPFGVFNIVGNVDEWTSRGGAGGRRSVLRGGWWLKGRNRCRAATGSHGENYAGAQTGFRCCKAAR